MWPLFCLPQDPKASEWLEACPSPRLTLTTDVSPATMSPMQSHTQDQDSKALRQKGLVQPTGSCVTLIQPLYLTELHFALCKIRAMPVPHVEGTL